MKKTLLALLLTFITAASPAAASAQSATDDAPGKNPVEEIMEQTNGNVEIIIPNNILNSLMANPSKKRSTTSQQSGSSSYSGIRKMQGFRIQVFSDGRNQHSLEARAKARGNAIVAKFPKYRGQVYTFSSAPNWYTRIGNFQTSAEASQALAELKRAFPSFAGEMRIVRSQVSIIK